MAGNPYIVNEIPVPDSIDVDPRALISCDVMDRSGGGLLLDRITVLVNGLRALEGGFLFSPFSGPLSSWFTTSVDGYDGYHIVLDPTEDMSGQVVVQVGAEDAYGGAGGGSWSFRTDGPLNLLYYADTTGVYRIHMPNLAGETQSVAVRLLSADTIPALPTSSVSVLSGNKIGDDMFLLTSMYGYPDSYGVFITKNEVNDPRYYLEGYDAYGAQMTDDGTMYVINRNMNRVEVYYGADARSGNRVPDFTYDEHSTPPLISGTLLDLHVVSGYSVVHSGGTRFYVGSTDGMVRVDTYDEESPDGYCADMDGYGQSWTYGVLGSGMRYEVIGSPADSSTARRVVAVHSDDETGMIFVLTNDNAGHGGLTQINMNTNRRILFMNQQGGFLPSNFGRDVRGKNP